MHASKHTRLYTYAWVHAYLIVKESVRPSVSTRLVQMPLVPSTISVSSGPDQVRVRVRLRLRVRVRVRVRLRVSLSLRLRLRLRLKVR